MTARRLKNAALGELCDQIDYHIVDQLQPHGIFLALDPSDFTIRHCSDTVANLFVRGAAGLIGQDFLSLLESTVSASFAAAVTDHPEGLGRWQHDVRFREDQVASPELAIQSLILFRNEYYICVEIDLTDDRDFLDRFPITRYAAHLKSICLHEGNKESLIELLCKYLIEILNVDRIYYLVFSGDGSGYVSHEKSNGFYSSLNGHHFPATDIPQNIRLLYVENRFRYFRSTVNKASPIVGASAPAPAMLDLRYSFFRPPGDTHIQYLRNMGVTSSLSFSVIRNGGLSGMFGGHNADERAVSYRQMLAASALVAAFTGRLNFLETVEERRAYSAKFSLLQSLVDAFEALDHDFARLFASHYQDLCAVAEADHFVARFDGALYHAPTIAEPLAIALLRVAENALSPESPLISTDCLSAADGKLFLKRHKISGMLALTLDKHTKNILIWGRIGQLRVEKWAGDPAHAVQMDASNRVGPRKSFKTWVKHVENRSLEWLPHTISTASRFREMFSQSLIQYFSSQDLMAWKAIASDLELMKKFAETANEQKTLFLSNVSHELRTPLHTIMSFTDVLLEKHTRLSKAKTEQYLGLISNSASHLLLMVNDLLNISKQDIAEISCSLQKHDLGALIAAIVKELQPSFAKKSLQVTIDSSVVKPELIFDRQRIRQVFTNLLSNAVKFSHPKGTIAIQLSEQCRVIRDAGVAVRIEDQGIGIPPDELTSIFNYFTQSSRTRSEAGGWGLGLAICRNIVEAHEGAIWAETSPQGGAVFFVEIPRASPVSER